MQASRYAVVILSCVLVMSTNVWRSITQAGLIVAEVSVPNPNVYYEIGRPDALRKACIPF